MALSQLSGASNSQPLVARVSAEYPNQLDYSGPVVTARAKAHQDRCRQGLPTWVHSLPLSSKMVSHLPSDSSPRLSPGVVAWLPKLSCADAFEWCEPRRTGPSALGGRGPGFNSPRPSHAKRQSVRCITAPHQHMLLRSFATAGWSIKAAQRESLEAVVGSLRARGNDRSAIV